MLTRPWYYQKTICDPFQAKPAPQKIYQKAFRLP
jgi:hypothetical protein